MEFKQTREATQSHAYQHISGRVGISSSLIVLYFFMSYMKLNFVRCVGCLILGAALCLGVFSQLSQGTHDLLHVLPEDLSLGSVWAQSAFPWKLRLQNTSDKDLVISRFDSTCSCVGRISVPIIIPAHKTVAVNVTLNLMPTTLAKSRLNKFAFTVGLAAVIEGAQDTYHAMWKLQGSVSNWLSASEPEIHFGNDLVSGTTYPSKFIDLDLVGPVELVQVNMTPELGTAVLLPTDCPADRYRRLAVTPSPTQSGSLVSYVELSGKTKSGRQLGIYRIPIYAEVVDDLLTDPSPLVFNARTSGETGDLFFQVSSRSGAELSSLAVVPRLNDQLQLEVKPAKDSLHTFIVRVRALSNATQTAQGVLAVSGQSTSNGALLTTTVPVIYNSAMRPVKKNR